MDKGINEIGRIDTVMEQDSNLNGEIIMTI